MPAWTCDNRGEQKEEKKTGERKEKQKGLLIAAHFFFFFFSKALFSPLLVTPPKPISIFFMSLNHFIFLPLKLSRFLLSRHPDDAAPFALPAPFHAQANKCAGRVAVLLSCVLV